ncbi:class I SAM-dependent methyltransferase [Tuwongella immobilis]|uniref:Uncharacterized protein n=1 Tax=Tuwongella immobilis TaxID=692036 RepID=A0A6C2YUI7_9BACT|nr:class I SAM-dependent methyltransferase [Tuwongella immobilis]VIP05017.1 tetracenomycin c synthesis protein : Gll0338 protein OS=Gloeobacter violaceus (strain PCC 7421) GN=gll0338 PE=4 SV=1: LCM [Tuwongella immobilis]VTS07392.1 tetracenomycin c synthesis protein : Gll0338 protein OS=Gloeobacter violaceus (strain PCC 7421) GN=gll0338 PE=4 SV=1: LCM [Tuwongella immobilis]
MGRVTVELGAVQETMLLPLIARAVEMRSKRPMVHDPKSLEIAEALEYDFRNFRAARRSRIGCLMRGLQFDDWVRAFLAEHPTGTIVELGAGLNTRFERLDNGQAHWVDVDLPDSMALRRQFFDPHPRRKWVADSITNVDWQAVVRECPGPVCFVSEAVLVYLPLPAVQQLMGQLAAEFPGSWMLCDFVHPDVVRDQHRHDALKHTQARLAWGLESAREMSDWAEGLTVVDVADMQIIGQRYHRRMPLGMKLMGLMLKLLAPQVSRSYTLTRLQLGGCPMAVGVTSAAVPVVDSDSDSAEATPLCTASAPGGMLPAPAQASNTSTLAVKP